MDIRISVEPHDAAPTPAPAPAPAGDGQHEGAARPANSLGPASSRRVKGQDMRLKMQVDPAPSPSFTFRPYSSMVPQNQFKLQWPQSPVGGPQFFTPRARPQTAGRLSTLVQPPNRTPRAWQKMQQRDQEEAEAHTPRERLHPPASAGRHRPGWLSARREPSGHDSARVQSARAHRPPEWKSGAESLGSTVNSGTMKHTGGEPVTPHVQTSSFEQIVQEEERHAREEMREYRDKLFENPKRRFTKREMENFCLKLQGSTDTQQMHRICAKAQEDRSYEDCTFLCKMLSKCNFVQQNMSPPTMLAISRCIKGRSLAPGEDLLIDDKTPQIIVLVQGLLAEPESGTMMKQGEYILRMPKNVQSFKPSASSKWGRSFSKVSLGFTLNRKKTMSSLGVNRRKSVDSSSEARSSANPSASSSRTASPEPSPHTPDPSPLVSCYASLSLALSRSLSLSVCVFESECECVSVYVCGVKKRREKRRLLCLESQRLQQAHSVLGLGPWSGVLPLTGYLPSAGTIWTSVLGCAATAVVMCFCFDFLNLCPSFTPLLQPCTCVHMSRSLAELVSCLSAEPVPAND